jgi:hypothetical protein
MGVPGERDLSSGCVADKRKGFAEPKERLDGRLQIGFVPQFHGRRK